MKRDIKKRIMGRKERWWTKGENNNMRTTCSFPTFDEAHRVHCFSKRLSLSFHGQKYKGTLLWNSLSLTIAPPTSHDTTWSLPELLKSWIHSRNHPGRLTRTSYTPIVPLRTTPFFYLPGPTIPSLWQLTAFLPFSVRRGRFQPIWIKPNLPRCSNRCELVSRRSIYI